MSADVARLRHGPVTHRSVLAIALPIVLSNVSEPLISVVDTAVIGQLGEAYLIGAIALSGIIFAYLFWMFGFLRMGTTGLTAQALGREDTAELRAILWRAMLIGLAAGAFYILMQKPISSLALALTEGSVAAESAAARYFTIRIWSAPAALMNFALLGWFIGLGRARTAFALQLILNLTNIALDALFVLVFEMSVEGVALGTLIAEYTALLAGLVFVWRTLPDYGPAKAATRIFSPRALKVMMAVNTDLFIRSILLMSAFAWFTAQGAKAGDVTLAANAVLINLFLVVAFFLDGFAFAAEALVGRSVGRRDRAAFDRAVYLSSFWAVTLSLMAALAVWLGGNLFIDLLSTNLDVRTQARAYLIWAALTPITGVACFQFDGIFTGATRTGDMRNMMILSFAAYIALWALLAPAYGNHGLWIALNAFFVIRGVTLALRYPALVRSVF